MLLKQRHGIITNGLEFINPPQVLREDLLRAFTFDNPTYANTLRFSPYGQVSSTIPKVIELVEHTDRGILVPRGFDESDLSRIGRKQFATYSWKDKRLRSPVTFPRARLTLNDEQQRLMDNFNALIRSGVECPYGNVLYVAPTSAGKTILQMTLAATTGQRTLVLCLTDLIKRAWLADLYSQYGLAPKDIGLIQQKTWRIGEQFTLASIKTLARRHAQWPDLFKQFGCVVVDEAHTITAPSIYRFVAACPCKFLIGATATEGSANFYLTSYFGRTRKKLLGQQKDTASSLALKTVRRIKTSFTFEYRYDAGVDWAKLTEALATNEDRNKLIVKEVKRDWDKGRSVLVTTKRTAHVHLLVDMLQEAGVTDCNVLTGETNADRFYTEKLVECICNKSVRCVVATNEAVKIGANLPPLEVLHVCMPVVQRHNLEQLIGRIRRRYKDKKVCELVYYEDIAVRYLSNVFRRSVMSVLRKLRVPGYTNRFEA
jgi:superfamily II DNA or RNA helicase